MTDADREALLTFATIAAQFATPIVLLIILWRVW